MLLPALLTFPHQLLYSVSEALSRCFCWGHKQFSARVKNPGCRYSNNACCVGISLKMPLQLFRSAAHICSHAVLSEWPLAFDKESPPRERDRDIRLRPRCSRSSATATFTTSLRKSTFGMGRFCR